MTAEKLDWTATPPGLHDIVTCWFPDSDNMTVPGLKLRPGLVTAVLFNPKTGARRYRINYGTSKLKYSMRGRIDLLIQKAAHLDRFKLDEATRFDLDHFADLPWSRRFFGCWDGFDSPILSSLDDNYIGKLKQRMERRSARFATRPAD